MTTRTIDKSDWQSYLDGITKSLTGIRAEVEVASLNLGDQIQAEWVPLIGVTYDPKDDLIEVALEGLDHMIQKPVELDVDEGPDGLHSLSIVDGDKNRQIVRLHRAVAVNRT